MPGIGDYIHLSQRGYEDHGIKRDGNYKPTQGFQFGKEKYSVKTNNQMSKKNLNRLTQLITAIMNPSSNNIRVFTSKDQQDLIKDCNQALVEKMLQDVHGTTEDFKKDKYGIMNKIIKEQKSNIHNFLDFENDVIRQEIKNNQVAQITDNFWTMKNNVNSVTGYKTIETMLNKIKENIDKLITYNLVKKPDLENLNAQYDILEKELERVADEVSFNKLPAKRRKELKKQGVNENAKFTVISSKSDDAHNLYDKVRALYNQIVYNSTIQLYQGPLGERAASLGVAMLLEYYLKTSYTTAKRSLIESALSGGTDGHIVGDVATETVIKVENFDKSIVDAIKGGVPGTIKTVNGKIETPSGNGELLYHFGETQGKVDVAYELDTTTDLQPPLNFSIKNVNSGSYIHLVSGTSLLFLLQDIPSDYVNHYLNIVGTQTNTSNRGNTYYQGHSFPNGDPVQAIQAAIFQKALVGSKIKEGVGGQANYFIAIIKGKVYIKSTNEVAEKIINKDKLKTAHFSLGQAKDNVKSKKSISLSDFRRYNLEASSAEARISGYIARLAATKISVYINQSAITKS